MISSPFLSSSERRTRFIFAGAIAVLMLTVLMYALWPQRAVSTLTRSDLPAGAALVPHHHIWPTGLEEELGAEMEHYATPEALAAGGPIFGVYGYRIVAIEYEIPPGRVIAEPIGKDDPGILLTSTSLGFAKDVRYDHVHLGIIKDADSNVNSGTHLIHFMLISHEEEMAIGLSCR